MNKEKEDGGDPGGFGWASQNLVHMCDCLAWSSFWVEFACLGIGCIGKKREWKTNETTMEQNRDAIYHI